MLAIMLFFLLSSCLLSVVSFARLSTVPLSELLFADLSSAVVSGTLLVLPVFSLFSASAFPLSLGIILFLISTSLLLFAELVVVVSLCSDNIGTATSLSSSRKEGSNLFPFFPFFLPSIRRCLEIDILPWKRTSASLNSFR